MDCSTPELPVHHQLPKLLKLMSTESVIRSNNFILYHHLYSCLQSFPASGSFQMSQFFTRGGQSIRVSASASALPMNVQGWFPLGFTGWISYTRDAQESSPTPQFKSINSSVHSFLYSSTLTSTHDHWRNQGIDRTDLCWQSNVSAF